MRIKLKEISINRISEAIQRRLVNIPNEIIWALNFYKGYKKNDLKAFFNIHAGERCVLIANGPSLKKTDINLLKNEITVGMNRIYLLFDNLGFNTTYYTVSNELVISQFKSDIEKLSSIKFVNWNARKFFSACSNLNFLKMNLSIEDKFSINIVNGIYSGGTVTYATLQLLYYMGFAEVIIVGLDHNFYDKGQPNKTEIRKAEVDANHFHPNYFPKGVKWQLPDLHRSELAYIKAKKMYEADGRRIIDATIGGNCTIFEKADYYSIFASTKMNKI